MNTNTKKAIIACLIITGLLVLTTLVIYQRVTHEFSERENVLEIQNKLIEAELDSIRLKNQELVESLATAGQSDSLISRFIDFAWELPQIAQSATDESELTVKVESYFTGFLSNRGIIPGHERNFITRKIVQLGMSLQRQQITAGKALLQERRALAQVRQDLQVERQRTNNSGNGPVPASIPAPRIASSSKDNVPPDCAGMGYYTEAELNKHGEKTAQDQQSRIVMAIQEKLDKEYKQKTFLGVAYSGNPKADKLQDIRQYIAELSSK